MRISDWSPDVCSSDLSRVVSQRKVKLSELDINNSGGWPRPYKIGFCVLLGALIFGLLWWVVTRDKGDQLEQLDKREANMRKDSGENQGRAPNLDPHKQPLDPSERQLQQITRPLPSKTEKPT